MPQAGSLLAPYRPPALPVLRMPLLQPPGCRPPERRPPLSAALVPALRIWTTARSRRHRRQARRPQSRQQRSAATCGPAARLKQAQTTVAMVAALWAWRSSMPGQGPDQAVAQVAPMFAVRSPVPAQARLPGPEQAPSPESSILQARTRALAPALVPAQERVRLRAWFPAPALGAARGPGPGQAPPPELSMIQARAWISVLA